MWRSDSSLISVSLNNTFYKVSTSKKKHWSLAGITLYQASGIFFVGSLSTLNDNAVATMLQFPQTTGYIMSFSNGWHCLIESATTILSSFTNPTLLYNTETFTFTPQTIGVTIGTINPVQLLSTDSLTISTWCNYTKFIVPTSNMNRTYILGTPNEVFNLEFGLYSGVNCVHSFLYDCHVNGTATDPAFFLCTGPPAIMTINSMDINDVGSYKIRIKGDMLMDSGYTKT
jgi:hypothetical protein